mmetsp:Transcript_32340/g.62441  ORF Transcript_32340/g.62441 Transcript_32340/m.62441 type:complete len:172 (+) Transcript_32340:45-560(+)
MESGEGQPSSEVIPSSSHKWTIPLDVEQGKLWLGSSNSCSDSFFKDFDIEYAVNLGAGDTQSSVAQNIKLPISNSSDIGSSNTMAILEKIHNALQNGKSVYVHSDGDSSRPTALALAYLMAQGLSLSSARAKLREIAGGPQNAQQLRIDEQNFLHAQLEAFERSATSRIGQ